MPGTASEESVFFKLDQSKRQILMAMAEDEHFFRVMSECFEIYRRKNHDYTRGRPESDALDNFREAAAQNEVTVLQAWGVQFYKHIAAVWKFVRDGSVESEPIEGRLYDVINYTILLLLYVKELRHAEQREGGEAT